MIEAHRAFLIRGASLIEITLLQSIAMLRGAFLAILIRIASIIRRSRDYNVQINVV